MTLLAVVLWGVVVGLDGASVIQSMISRPIFAATVTGAILGHPLEGLALGVVLEIFALLVLPIGAARYPESGIGSVAGVWSLLSVDSTALTAAPLLLATAFALGWERVAGGSVILLRRINERLIADAQGRGPVGPGRLQRLHIGAIGVDGARAGIVTLTGALLGGWLVGGLSRFWGLGDEAPARALVIALAITLGATLSLFGADRRARLLLLAGVACGLVILALR